MKNYQQLALRTLAPNMGAINRFNGNALGLLAITFNRAITHAIIANELKSWLFYGKGRVPDAVRGLPVVDSPVSEKDMNLIHAALGMITEAAEFAQALSEHLFSGLPLDETNLAEEIGDQAWFGAIAAHALGLTVDQIQEQNIAKLRTRYPEKFTEAAAVNRDLVAERAVLAERGIPGSAQEDQIENMRRNLAVLDRVKAERDGWKASFGHENAKLQEAQRTIDRLWRSLSGCVEALSAYTQDPSQSETQDEPDVEAILSEANELLALRDERARECGVPTSKEPEDAHATTP